MKRITDTVYNVDLFGGAVNFYVVDTGSGLAVIDMGASPDHLKALETGLHRNNLAMANVNHLLVTHTHSDHVGCLAALQQRTQATTYAHTADAPIIRGNQAVATPDASELNIVDRMLLPAIRGAKFAPARVDIEIMDGDTLDDVIPGLQVVHLPGHTHGHVGYWLPEERILFGGDVIMNFFGRITMPFHFASPDWAQAKASVKKVADMNPHILCSGHGPVLVGNVRERVAPLLRRMGVN